MIQPAAVAVLVVTGAVIGAVISIRGWHPQAPERAAPPVPGQHPGGGAPMVTPPARGAHDPRPGKPGPEQTGPPAVTAPAPGGPRLTLSVEYYDDGHAVMFDHRRHRKIIMPSDEDSTLDWDAFLRSLMP